MTELTDDQLAEANSRLAALLGPVRIEVRLERHMGTGEVAPAILKVPNPEAKESCTVRRGHGAA